jgi:hypothetical protein
MFAGHKKVPRSKEGLSPPNLTPNLEDETIPEEGDLS